VENEDPTSEWLKQYADSIVLFLETNLKKTLLSTIIDLSSPVPIIVRKGAIPILEIERVLGRKVKLGGNVYFSVLMVCSGNSCRSPMAKGILEKMLEKKNVFVYSAGTIAGSGNLPSEFAVIAAKSYGADITHHLSAPLTKELINNADLILVMSPKHKDSVLELEPSAKAKTFLLREYAFKTNEEIIDPVGQPLAVFEKVAKEINECLKKVAEDIKERLN
jgi:protein-tyrosine-phosphatase